MLNFLVFGFLFARMLYKGTHAEGRHKALEWHSYNGTVVSLVRDMSRLHVALTFRDELGGDEVLTVLLRAKDKTPTSS